MLIKESLKTAVKIEAVFSQALVEGNKDTLLNILSDDGEYMIQGKDLNTIEVDKLIFIDWILNQRKSVESLAYYFDQCTFCKIGNPVAIFNNGYFPVKPKDLSERVRIGLMFVINNQKIEEINFCSSFIETDNECGFEQKRKKLVQEYMSKNGVTREQAIQEMKEDTDRRNSVNLDDLDDLTKRILKKVYPDMNF